MFEQIQRLSILPNKEQLKFVFLTLKEEVSKVQVSYFVVFHSSKCSACFQYFRYCFVQYFHQTFIVLFCLTYLKKTIYLLFENNLFLLLYSFLFYKITGIDTPADKTILFTWEWPFIVLWSLYCHLTSVFYYLYVVLRTETRFI